jgi:hypothetical protein
MTTSNRPATCPCNDGNPGHSDQCQCPSLHPEQQDTALTDDDRLFLIGHARDYARPDINPERAAAYAKWYMATYAGDPGVTWDDLPSSHEFTWPRFLDQYRKELTAAHASHQAPVIGCASCEAIDPGTWRERYAEEGGPS